MSHEERCKTCDEPATAYDYDQYKVFCAKHVEQPGFTVPLDDFISKNRKVRINMATDQERAEELLHYIGNEPSHGNAIAAIVKEFENVRAATLSAFTRAHVPFQHDTDGPSAIDALVTGVFNDELERHRKAVAECIQKLDTPHLLYDAVSFLLALAQPLTPGGVVKVGGSSPLGYRDADEYGRYGRCLATLEGERCVLVTHLGSPHQAESGQRWEDTGGLGARKL